MTLAQVLENLAHILSKKECIKSKQQALVCRALAPTALRSRDLGPMGLGEVAAAATSR